MSQYIYGELSALTIGKIFRMLGSKLQLPPPIDKTGFEEGLVVSILFVNTQAAQALNLSSITDLY